MSLGFSISEYAELKDILDVSYFKNNYSLISDFEYDLLFPNHLDGKVPSDITGAFEKVEHPLSNRRGEEIL